ncbi:MAG: DUF3887 domain-containing protein [Peptoniphilaceae bacterium]
MKNFKKIGTLILLLLLVTSCGNKNGFNKLSEKDSKEYVDMAQEIVLNVNDGNIEALKSNASSELKNGLDDKISNQIKKDISSKGNFDSFEESEAIKDKNGNIVIIQEAKYGQGKLIYTITFDKNNELIGFYYK